MQRVKKKEKHINKSCFLHTTHPQSIFPSFLKLILSSAIDLLDFIEIGS